MSLQTDIIRSSKYEEETMTFHGKITTEHGCVYHWRRYDDSEGMWEITVYDGQEDFWTGYCPHHKRPMSILSEQVARTLDRQAAHDADLN